MITRRNFMGAIAGIPIAGSLFAAKLPENKLGNGISYDEFRSLVFDHLEDKMVDEDYWRKKRYNARFVIEKFSIYLELVFQTRKKSIPTMDSHDSYISCSYEVRDSFFYMPIHYYIRDNEITEITKLLVVPNHITIDTVKDRDSLIEQELDKFIKKSWMILLALMV